VEKSIRGGNVPKIARYKYGGLLDKLSRELEITKPNVTVLSDIGMVGVDEVIECYEIPQPTQGYISRMGRRTGRTVTDGMFEGMLNVT